MAAAPAGDRSLQETPTWALALVCAVFVIISILIEHGIHSLEKWFQKRHNKAMTEALEKIKAELMLLGFISLLLTVGTKYIAKICIPAKYGDDMLPCKTNYDNNDEGDGNDDNGNDRRRKLLSLAGNVVWRRVLAAAGGGDDYCNKKDKVPLISQTGVHQLHIFIFVLAVFHVLYSVLTMALAQAKMKKWKTWESETSSLEYQFTNDPSRFRLAHQTSFVKRHSGISTAPGIRWIVAFFRQFFGSVNKVDYLTMRNGFINAHFAPNSKFDFHKYIKRCMEDDFKVVVGISIPLWVFAVLFLLLNVYRWYTLTWLTIVPFIILLLVGTKLELVIMEMAQEIQARTTVVRGAPVVEPNNKYFWFNRPQWILFLLHYTLFQNAFQMAFFLWTWYEFGLKSCFHENLAAILVRVGLGVALQIVCSYITFPLYALVTQMGSHMKQSIFEEQTAKALRKWQKAAKQRKKARKAGTCGGGNSSPGFMSGETTPSQGASPIHLLHGHKYRSSQRDVESVISSPKSYRSDTDFSELSETEGSSHHGRESRKQEDQGKNDQEPQTNDFSFVRI
ncbi:MLO protein homolog 1 [Jatropha curcas]|uniref:MLO protein homolog 1 n=1 Tax=Jatropha curcas TaxID=180498 RepID=UPI0005FBF0C2|nr:MLO protein homolog 1 [Jatropha curcas]